MPPDNNNSQPSSLEIQLLMRILDTLDIQDKRQDHLESVIKAHVTGEEQFQKRLLDRQEQLTTKLAPVIELIEDAAAAKRIRERLKKLSISSIVIVAPVATAVTYWENLLEFLRHLKH